MDDLIFDIGGHRGHDTDFYLKKGFRVVTIEANTEMCEEIKSAQKEAIASSRLFVYNYAILSKDDQRPVAVNGDKVVQFPVCTAHDDWSSLERPQPNPTVISVKVITIDELIRKHGTPYYLKADIEGGEGGILRDLYPHKKKPYYISVEASNFEWMAWLSCLGYSKFKIINQQQHERWIPPNPPREGKFVSVQWNHYHSGLFGKESIGDWMNLEDACYELTHVNKKFFDRTNIGPGWYDIHASRA